VKIGPYFYFSFRQIRPPPPTLPRLTSHTSRWYTLLALPDQNRLARRDLRGFRPDPNLTPPLASSPNLPSTYLTSNQISAQNNNNNNNNNKNNANTTIRASDIPSNERSSPQGLAPSRVTQQQQQQLLLQATALRRSIGAGVRSPNRPRTTRPIASGNLSETLQVRMANNAQAAAARARKNSPRRF
jgi:hypothetical protein